MRCGALGVSIEDCSLERFGRGEEAVMTDDRWYIPVNDRERARLRAFIAGLDDEALAAPANASWTVAGVLGHLAY
jgi:Mycothiol maleylpyruvate isomerase N-terminal domain